MLGKLLVGEIAVGEVVTGKIVLGKLRWGNDLTPNIHQLYSDPDLFFRRRIQEPDMHQNKNAPQLVLYPDH